MTNFIHQRIKRIEWAWSGLILFVRTETHAVIHIAAAIIVMGLGFLFSINTLEWIALFFAIGLVIQAEILNSVIEKLLDFIYPGIHPEIKTMKDMAAGAVLWTSIIAIIIGGIVFVPYILR